jgi:hypothetical protein
MTEVDDRELSVVLILANHRTDLDRSSKDFENVATTNGDKHEQTHACRRGASASLRKWQA